MPDTCSPPHWSAPLLELLERQERIVDELAGLADRQHDLIASRRTDALLSLLTERQRLIDDFGAAQDALGDLGGEVERRAHELDPERREVVQTTIARIGERLATVMKGDAVDQARLEACRGEVADEVAATGATKQVHAAYRGAPATGGSRFTDERG